jgi:hypothetical protein
MTPSPRFDVLFVFTFVRRLMSIVTSAPNWIVDWLS